MSSLFSDKNALYILTILESVEKIKLYSNGFKSAEDLFFADDQMQYNAVCHLLIAIGEETKKIDESLKETQSFIAWKQISGMRNRMAHDYRGIDKEVIFSIVKNELPTLQKACENLLSGLKLSRMEFEVLLNNPFFSHLQHLKPYFRRSKD